MKKILLLVLLFCISVYSQTADRIEGSPYPVSQKPDTLYKISDANYNESQMLTMQTLQGLLAQKKPRLYRITTSSYNIWLNDLKNNYGVTVIDSLDGAFAALIKLFKNEINGYVICNTGDNSVNAAISLCGIKKCIAVTADNESIVSGLGIPKIDDVRGKDEAWFFDNYGSQVNKNIFCFQKETKDNFLADYSVFGKMMTFYNDSFDAKTNEMFASFNPNSALMGWGFDEFQLVSQASNYNEFVHASDYASNLSTFSNFSATVKQKQPDSTVSNDENIHTVCFLMTDGDNIDWLFNQFVDDTNYYANPNRGKMKLGWSESPAMTELSPTILKYVYDNAACNSIGRDYFIASVSGLGYIYPDKYKDLQGFASLTNKYMKKADMRIVNILGNNDNSQYLLPYLQQDNIDAIFYYFYSNYSGGQGKVTFVNNKPVIYGRYNLWDGFETSTSLAKKLNLASKNIYSSAGYSLVPVHVWSRSVTDVMNCIKQLNSNVRVVSPDEFVSLISKNLKPRTNILQFVPNNNSTELAYLLPGYTGTSYDSESRWADYNDKIIYKFNLDTLAALSNNVKDLLLSATIANEYLVSVSNSLDGPWDKVFQWSADTTVNAHVALLNKVTLSVNLNKYYDKGWHTLYLKFEDGMKSDAFGSHVYNIAIAQPQTATEVKNTPSDIPTAFELKQNYPNPFNPSTQIEYRIQKNAFVTLKVYDALGRAVKTLVNENKNTGSYTVSFNGANLASGVYFYVLKANEGGGNNPVLVKKMMLIK